MDEWKDKWIDGWICKDQGVYKFSCITYQSQFSLQQSITARIYYLNTIHHHYALQNEIAFDLYSLYLSYLE